ncbi:hypothetical protein PF011_g8472 [Phytophthora fragariae]|uniref:Protein ENHANCED DISEASE RESISTANCE 2 C-terminal domain-containing protein n=1 Tax=Phytophthora fragariae TaxID=53985 RepID=A0A6A3L1I3_9STRA|nr:hypothetical protein PF011_g8472 [Phytophthora fragariae]
MQFKLRSKTYLQNKIKETTAPPLFELVWFEAFKGTHEELMHVPLVTTVQYFARTKSTGAGGPTEAEKLWERFLNGDDEFRKARFKLIPTIADGPWVIRKAVGTTPCIIGKAIQTTYYQTPNYLEVHVDISSDTIAKHITSLCRSQSTSFAVNMGFVIEGQTEEELPEALLGCVQYAHMDLLLASDINDDE